MSISDMQLKRISLKRIYDAMRVPFDTSLSEDAMYNNLVAEKFFMNISNVILPAKPRADGSGHDCKKNWHKIDNRTFVGFSKNALEYTGKSNTIVLCSSASLENAMV